MTPSQEQLLWAALNKAVKAFAQDNDLDPDDETIVDSCLRWADGGDE